MRKIINRIILTVFLFFCANSVYAETIFPSDFEISSYVCSPNNGNCAMLEEEELYDYLDYYSEQNDLNIYPDPNNYDPLVNAYIDPTCTYSKDVVNLSLEYDRPFDESMIEIYLPDGHIIGIHITYYIAFTTFYLNLPMPWFLKQGCGVTGRWRFNVNVSCSGFSGKCNPYVSRSIWYSSEDLIERGFPGYFYIMPYSYSFIDCLTIEDSMIQVLDHVETQHGPH